MSDFEKRDTTAEIRKAVEKFFERDKIKHEPFNERNVAKAIYSLDIKFGHAMVYFYAYKDKLVLRTVIPLNSDEAEHAKVAEFLLRANCGLKFGGFDFDFDDGEISYRVTLFCGKDEFTPPTYEQIDVSVIVSLLMLEKYGNALVKVMFGLVEPKDAVADAEKDD